SLKGRLRAFIWRIVGPPLETQRRFNAALVDHINRNVAAHQQAQQATAALIDAARREFEALIRFESLLVQYLQTITMYVDSKDRSAGGREMRDRVALAEQRVAALKRELDAMAARGARPAAPSTTPGADQNAPPAAAAFSASVDSLTYVGFEDRFRGSQEEIRG